MPTIKRVYHVSSVQQAWARARRELGEEALLLWARAARPEERHLGAYEVAVAAEIAALPQAPARTAGFSRALADLKAGLLGVSQALRCSRNEADDDCLAGLELPPEILDRWRELAGADAGRAPTAEALKTAFPRLVSCEPKLGSAGVEPARVALVGPAGTGKTSLLAKLAFRFGLREGRDAVLLSTDTQRVAAGEPLRAYAAILGIPIIFAETPWNLEQALRQNMTRGLALVDTPGYGPGEMQSAGLWAGCLAGIEGLDVHLVLNAQARTADQLRVIDRWAAFRPARLAFTHVDEAGSTAGIVAAAARSGLPVSFLGVGRVVPEDLEEATPERVLAGLFGPREHARAAAY